MEDNIKEIIIERCRKGKMNMDSLSINNTEDGFIATDGYTSILFDKNGNYASLPMHKLYGNKATKAVNFGFKIYSFIIIAVIVIIIFISIFIK